MVKVGTMVKVRPPKKEWRRMTPWFISDMDKYVGGTYKITDVDTSSHEGIIVVLEGLTLPHGRAIRWRLEWLEIIPRLVIGGDAL